MIRSIQLNMSVFDLSRAKYAEIPVAARHFFEEFHTMYQFAQKHYISESTAHRKINEWKQQLQTYGIRLQRGTYIAQGEEEIIRLLAYDILAVVSRKIWPFETISQMDVKNMAEHIMAFLMFV